MLYILLLLLLVIIFYVYLYIYMRVCVFEYIYIWIYLSIYIYIHIDLYIFQLYVSVVFLLNLEFVIVHDETWSDAAGVCMLKKGFSFQGCYDIPWIKCMVLQSGLFAHPKWTYFKFPSLCRHKVDSDA